jgi:hypothetical protein
MARPWSARCYGVARQREGSRQNSIGPRVNLTYQPYARADGQAVVCPLLRGSSATRGVPRPTQRPGVQLDIFPGQQHSFQMAAGRAPEADDAIRKLAQWVRPRLGLANSAGAAAI